MIVFIHISFWLRRGEKHENSIDSREKNEKSEKFRLMLKVSKNFLTQKIFASSQMQKNIVKKFLRDFFLMTLINDFLR